MRYFYNFGFYIILPFLLLRLWWRSRSAPAYLLRRAERFARYKKISPVEKSIWVHSVSLGEAVAAIPLVKALQKKYLDYKIVVTSMTPTGAERLAKVFAEDSQIIQIYVPYDYSGAVKRFLKHFNPKLLIIMETELWPNILYYCKKNNIPIFLVNARLTEKSVQSYKKIKKFTTKMLADITLIMAQSQKDGANYLAIGADPKKVQVIVNIKFDLTIPDGIKNAGIRFRELCNAISRPVWVAASTHKGEEEQVLQAFAKIRESLPNVLLILVPRHLERFQEVCELCGARGFTVKRFSKITAVDEAKEICDENTDIILGDVMGKLLVFYAASDVAFVGGSLMPIGGHNVLEAAALGVPVVVGPHLETIPEISKLLLDAKGLMIVQDAHELAAQVLVLLRDTNLHQQYASAALEIVMQNKGVIDKILAAIPISI